MKHTIPSTSYVYHEKEEGQCLTMTRHVWRICFSNCWLFSSPFFGLFFTWPNSLLNNILCRIMNPSSLALAISSTSCPSYISLINMMFIIENPGQRLRVLVQWQMKPTSMTTFIHSSYEAMQSSQTPCLTRLEIFMSTSYTSFTSFLKINNGPLNVNTYLMI